MFFKIDHCCLPKWEIGVFIGEDEKNDTKCHESRRICKILKPMAGMKLKCHAGGIFAPQLEKYFLS